MTLRCKPGDLAFIIKEEAGCEENIGTIVEVLYIEHSNIWNIRCTYKRLICVRYSFLKRTPSYDRAEINEELLLPDNYLFPIKGNKEDNLEVQETKQEDTIHES